MSNETESKAGKIRKESDTEVFVDPISGSELLVDFDSREVTNISREHKEVVQYLKWKFKAENCTPCLKGKMTDGKGIPFELYEVVNEETGELRVSIRNELTKKVVVFLYSEQ